MFKKTNSTFKYKNLVKYLNKFCVKYRVDFNINKIFFRIYQFIKKLNAFSEQFFC